MKKIKTFVSIFICVLFFTSPLLSQSSRPIISSIASSVSDDNTAIEVTWTIPQNSRFSNVAFLKVYRQTEAFENTPTLTNAQLIATVPATTTRIQDKVVDYKNYWYAVIAQNNDGSVFDILIPSVNATVLPCKIEVPASKSIEQTETNKENTKQSRSKNIDSMRETPLPCLHILPLQSKQDAGTISSEAKKVAEKMGSSTIPSPTIEPYVFENEINGEQSIGSDYSLYFIIDSYFQKKDWDSVKAELTNLLQVARPDEIVARANFYLGEAYYYQGDYRKAIDCFLISEEIYKPISRKWLEETLNKYMTN
ncbi:MAG: hypothetical protein BKP49_08400 [Treponema sp. CETP13]|nr:MAG: hypothetical protein BKP49_08400 [Treponema sp. CETP13]